ncbi:N-acetyltransferase family protein [Evansella sp. AB-rgal1]|uniref:GNAT family N-acetyltransferase n=1 Tax=Evansella sp. AB-rgal1 TaxID=3242696 RepID=UPI00359DCB02
MYKIRLATLDDLSRIAKVHIDSWRTTYKGIVSQEFIDSLTSEWSEERQKSVITNQNKFIYVAEDISGKIVGFASGGPERMNDQLYKGEIYAIYLLEEYQGKGIGRDLFIAVIKKLKRNGINSVIVLVLEDNISAINFYESLGGLKVKEGSLELQGIQYKDIGYGWMDTSFLTV